MHIVYILEHVGAEYQEGLGCFLTKSSSKVHIHITAFAAFFTPRFYDVTTVDIRKDLRILREFFIYAVIIHRFQDTEHLQIADQVGFQKSA